MTDHAQVEIDRSICSGHGRCYSVASDVFEPDDEGYGVVIAQPGLDQYENVRRAAQNCPEQAITVQFPTTAEDNR